MRQRPGKLLAICIIAIVLGALGLLGAAGGAVGMLFGAQMQNVANFGATEAQREVQKQMTQQVAAVAAKWQVFNVVTLAVHFVVAPCLLAGAILTLCWKPGGRRLLVAALLAAAVFELVRMGPAMMTARETQEITAEFMPKLMEAAAPPGARQPANLNAMMGGMMKAMVIAGMVLGIAMVAAKVIFYLIGAAYLRKPAVAALFADSSADNAWRMPDGAHDG